MRRIFFALFLCVLSTEAFSQRFSQYFTHSLYDSFENPAQSAFSPDSSKMYAFNFLVPNFGTNASLAGGVQNALRQYTFLTDSKPNLSIGENNFNHLKFNANVYLLMFRIFGSLDGNKELGFSAQVKGEGSAFFNNETVGLFDGGSRFQNGVAYNNYFNDKYWAQSYYQFSLTYRKNINSNFSVGYKLSALSGVIYNQVDVQNSAAIFDKAGRRFLLGLAGKYRASIDPRNFKTRDAMPLFSNPGASFSFGLAQRTAGGVNVQYNIKDLGFIYWRNGAVQNNFNDVNIVSTRGTNSANGIYNAAYNIFNNNAASNSFTTATDGRFEISATKVFALDDRQHFKYQPVLVASKQLFYNGFIGALVNNIQYKSVILGITSSYDELKQYNLGAQVMIRSPNFEFFIGTDQLLQGINLLKSHYGNLDAINKVKPYTDAGIFMGFSVKFGPDIETAANASHIPMGNQGFFGRLFDKVFKNLS